MTKQRITDVDQLPLMMKMRDVANVMDIALRRAYELAQNPTFPKIVVGKSIRVPRDAFFRWLDQETPPKEVSA
ncbi:DNA-binding protein [Brevibacillus sp. FSL K6-0770]|uniref:DNA-binding protein n=1 Tax=Brevibacillus sp. FSL K6-0770 TaxID=2954673 RepID=UPI0030FCE2D3